MGEEKNEAADLVLGQHLYLVNLTLRLHEQIGRHFVQQRDQDRT